MTQRLVRIGEVIELKYGKSLPATSRSGHEYNVYGSNGPTGYNDAAITKAPVIIIGRKGSIGEIHYSDQPCWPIDTTYYVDDFDGDILPRWLYYRLQRLNLKALNKAVAIPGLNRKDVYELEIPLPPLEEQRRIAAILDKVGHLNQLGTHFDSLRRQAGESLYLSLFGDPIVNPYGLPSQKIGEMADCQLGKMLDKKRQHGNSSRPYLRNANVRWFDVNTDDCLCMDIEESEMDRFGVMQGDLLVCEGGEPGRSAIWKGESGAYGFQKALHRIRPKKDMVNPQFLNWSFWILAQRGLLLDHITSATIAHLTREKLVQIEVPLPPMSVQKQFAQRLDKIEKLFAHSAFRQKRLSSLRLSLFSEFLV